MRASGPDAFQRGLDRLLEDHHRLQATMGRHNVATTGCQVRITVARNYSSMMSCVPPKASGGPV